MRLPPLRRAIKRVLPTSLFARALLILIVPLVILQIIVAHIFFERHWDSVVRHLSNSAGNDITMLYNEYDYLALREELDEERLARFDTASATLGIGMVHYPAPAEDFIDGAGRRTFPELFDGLSNRLQRPIMVIDDKRAGEVRVRVLRPDDSVLEFDFGRKRLASSTTYIFIFWMLGVAALLMIIATLFLRNQIKPIVQLARAAEQFGMGQEVVEFSTRGASEIKRASSAFRTMADRIRRSVTSRTEMLAGISHDLRTPLTRMTLEIEMGKIDQATRDALEAEIEEMRAMIDEYLDFARGDAGEPMEQLDVGLMLKDLVDSYRRQRRPVKIGECDSVGMMVRPQAMRRALTNLIDNALRYGKTAYVELEQTIGFVRIKITDTGPGIPEDEFEAVFKPFTRLEGSRNIATGGVGLGLSIARDIAQSHGGNITLENQKDKLGRISGLEVTLKLPREVNI